MMDVNSYGYIVLVAGLGMSIVFLFLWFLSGLMSLIQLIFGEREGSPTGPDQGLVAPDAEARVASQGTEWVIAAAVAFLEAEQRDKISDPGPWVSGRAHQQDPWLSAPPRRMT